MFVWPGRQGDPLSCRLALIDLLLVYSLFAYGLSRISHNSRTKVCYFFETAKCFDWKFSVSAHFFPLRARCAMLLLLLAFLFLFSFLYRKSAEREYFFSCFFSFLFCFVGRCCKSRSMSLAEIAEIRRLYSQRRLPNSQGHLLTSAMRHPVCLLAYPTPAPPLRREGNGYALEADPPPALPNHSVFIRRLPSEGRGMATPLRQIHPRLCPITPFLSGDCPSWRGADAIEEDAASIPRPFEGNRKLGVSDWRPKGGRAKGVGVG